MIEYKLTCDICGMEGHLASVPTMACIKALRDAAGLVDMKLVKLARRLNEGGFNVRAVGRHESPRDLYGSNEPPEMNGLSML